MLCSDPLRVLPTLSSSQQVKSSCHQRCRRDNSITRFGQTNTLQELYCHYIVLDSEMHSQMGCTLLTHPPSQPLVWGHTGDPKGLHSWLPLASLPLTKVYSIASLNECQHCVFNVPGLQAQTQDSTLVFDSISTIPRVSPTFGHYHTSFLFRDFYVGTELLEGSQRSPTD